MLTAAAACGEARAAEPETRSPAEAALVAEDAWVRPETGGSFRIGVLFRLEPGWHLYWKNPGDSGLAPSIEWELPPGLEAGPVEWPYPEAIPDGPLMNYGYPSDVLLPVTVRVFGALPAGAPVTLKARVRWVVCRETCIPGKADLSLVLPVGTAPPGKNARAARGFAESAARRPVEIAAVPWSFRAARQGDRIVLGLAPAAGAGEIPENVTFFPETPEALVHAAPQIFEREAEGGPRLLLQTGPGEDARVLRGVLVRQDETGWAGPGSPRAVAIELELPPDTGA